jgi:ATP/maltotriose-dependent transcriptional regulator MalT
MTLDTARAHTYLACALAQNGLGRTAMLHIEYVRDWLEKQGNLPYLKHLYDNFAIAYVLVHDFAAALQALRPGDDRTESVIPFFALDVATWAHSYLGELDAALSARQQALELRARHGSKMLKEFFEAVHAEILLKLGKGTAVVELATVAARGARERGSMLAMMLAERVWGRALAAIGANATEVDAHLNASLSLAIAVGNVMEAMQTEIAWAEIHIERTAYATAREYFQRARDRLTEEMVPCTHAYYVPIIERGLKRCDAIVVPSEPGET